MKKRDIKAIKECLTTRWIPAMLNPQGSMPIFSPSCQLCDIYAGDPRFCEGCPVEEETRLTECEGTPYYKWLQALSGEEQRDAAEQEVDFLLSLLPKGETVEYKGYLYSWTPM